MQRWVTRCWLFIPLLAGWIVLLGSESALPDDFTARRQTGGGGPRKLAPGVLTIISAHGREQETFSGPQPIVELVADLPDDWTPHSAPKSQTLAEMAKRVIFRREVWQLEFAFKPVRMIHVDLPQRDGRMQRKLVWYLIYRVKNTGHHANPAPREDEWGHKIFETQHVNHPIRFAPRFILESEEHANAYLDRVIPLAIEPIRQREDPNTRLHNSVEISQVNVPVSTDQVQRSVWGVATWEDIDPRIDFFSVDVKGLTNAYRWVDQPGAFKAGDPPGTGRRLMDKTLKLNFWRPGDEFRQHEGEIRYGIPGEVDHHWIYR